MKPAELLRRLRRFAERRGLDFEISEGQEPYEGRALRPTLGRRTAFDGPEDRDVAQHFEATRPEAWGHWGI